MSDNDDTKDLLWMFRRQPQGKPPGVVDFDPIDAIYHLQKNTHNPYLKRAIAPEKGKLDRTSAELTKLVKVLGDSGEYDIGPTNRNAPFSHRRLDHPPPPPTPKPDFQGGDRLSGDLQKLPWHINEFFRSILDRLKSNPREFDLVVHDLLLLFKEENIRIKIYDAYSSFVDWADLIDTLEEIAQYPSPETFDLFCSALFAYYDLVYPPGG